MDRCFVVYEPEPGTDYKEGLNQALFNSVNRNEMVKYLHGNFAFNVYPDENLDDLCLNFEYRFGPLAERK